jgi:hypothetical protein
MRKVSIVKSGLLAGALWLAGPAGALAVTAPGPAATGTCAVLDNTCMAADTTFTPTSVKISKSATTTSVVCSGTTTKKPTKATKCDGEALGGTSGETAPLQPCTITLGTTALTTDDWTEVITPSGNVKLICKSGGSDTK